MKRLLRLLTLAVIVPCFSYAQTCPAGYANTSLNWDNLDFLKQDATYISASQAQTQYFAFGTNRITVTHNYSQANTGGENSTHTGETSSYGTGDDVQFYGNGAITVTFQTAVQNIQFSLYDIDYNQKVTVTATNGTAQNVTLARATTTQLTIAGSGTTSASATGGATTAVATSSNDGTVNVDITGPVTSFTITVTQTGTKTNGNPSSQEDGSFWISDISACSNTSAFPTSYYAISQPFTNQPGYVLAALEDTILIVNPANGVSKMLFRDPSGNNINSLAYDPYNKFVYYTYSLTGAGGAVNSSDKSIQKYDVSTGTISTIVSNVTTLGIPTYTSGVESGGAAFYNGALYIGIEGEDGEESKIWRIDFDASFNPVTPAKQVYSMATDFHDWSDFGISNGVLIDFNGKSSGSSTHYETITHINLQTGATAAAYTYSTMGFVPRQVSVDWNEKLYNVGTAASASTGTIAPYASGVLTTAQQYTISKSGLNPSGSWGDAGEAYKPNADFGDAPSTYDPVALSPALHEISSTTLRLGSSVNDESAKKTSTLANLDTDDGMPYVAIVNQSGNYLANVNVYNNTGAPATVCAWVDFNSNGTFETSEGIAVTVSSSASLQNIDLFWPSPSNNLLPYSYTFIRIRITSQSNGMTIANPTGYYSNGEVEDYRVQVNAGVLPIDILSFEAKKVQTQAALSWKINDELPRAIYELEKSSNGQQWMLINKQEVIVAKPLASYDFVDVNPFAGMNYYRLKITKPGGKFSYSPVRYLLFDQSIQVQLFPNPATNITKLQIDMPAAGSASIRLLDAVGKRVYETSSLLTPGNNLVDLPVIQQLPVGTYQVELWVNKQRLTKRLVVKR
ncbi:MAG: type sorting protein [Flaviaesturariibacter sp.]|nr:type sorting protein [Flaviaesturariibacter sp.]